MKKNEIDKLREVCGTLPNRNMDIKSEIFFGCELLDIELVDKPENMWKSIFHMATATWGDDNYYNKWKQLSPDLRYLVVMSALKGKTLPTALEAPKFTFIVRGTPRHCFDQMARTRIGSGFGSIGCRDNSKLDSSFILYSEYKNMDDGTILMVDEILSSIKKTYKNIIKEGKESYQVARSILPMCYHHPFVFTQSLAALIGQSRRRMCFGEEEFICGIHWKIRETFKNMGYHLLADIMRPACDYAKRCLYSKSDGSELFSNLFKGCGRWPSDCEYNEFNKSCTDKNGLKKAGIEVASPEDYVNFGREDFEKLGVADKELFSSL